MAGDVVSRAKEFLSMFDIALVGNGACGGSEEQVNRSEAASPRRPGHDRTAVVTTADLSRWTSQLDAISDGDYLTDHHLDAALDGLLRDLDE
jgi:hypothetical protein